MYGTNLTGDSIRKIQIESDNYDALLTDFLSEILFISEVESLVFSGASVRIEGHSLTAELTGEPFNLIRHSGGTEVKGFPTQGLL